ncbi:NAD-dependent epimerase/dehydratase family protein [Sphingobacterium siyangense]|uniref:NAD-dependent epimerase/dehydratase family protein n=1 Tax=Sphingobacterium TaxID=28453 RepID=UPI00095878C5|nr:MULTISPECIES: NAD-dependent epimerase/dehydratase family protein [Sphingobacterium]APU95244.1 UDP-N-acetylglucosamine 4-epimerase [Sphingobacterium sp. B29]UQA75558.1 NAD-dependent epimerase/dehydratase family protein [Sphingobacterium siyangense]
MKIALIGGSGFLGTRLTELLLYTTDHEVVIIDKVISEKYPKLTRIGNVLDRDALCGLLQGVHQVVLLAAEHRDDVTPLSKYYEVNVKGMENTLYAMEANSITRIVFTSSVAVYGLGKENPNEATAVAPFNAYGESKLQAEKVLENWYASHADWNIQVIRPTVIFGEGNRGNVYNLLQQIASGRFMMIGKGNNQKSMSYIGNIVAFIAYLISEESMGFDLYNYGDKPDLTTNDLVYYTGKVLGKNIPTLRIPYALGLLGGYAFDALAFILRRKFAISSVRVRKFCAVTQYDSSKAMASGFQPPFLLQEGLLRTLESDFSAYIKINSQIASYENS